MASAAGAGTVGLLDKLDRLVSTTVLHEARVYPVTIPPATADYRPSDALGNVSEMSSSVPAATSPTVLTTVVQTDDFVVLPGITNPHPDPGAVCVSCDFCNLLPFHFVLHNLGNESNALLTHFPRFGVFFFFSRVLHFSSPFPGPEDVLLLNTTTGLYQQSVTLTARMYPIEATAAKSIWGLPTLIWGILIGTVVILILILATLFFCCWVQPRTRKLLNSSYYTTTANNGNGRFERGIFARFKPIFIAFCNSLKDRDSGLMLLFVILQNIHHFKLSIAYV